jgi:1,4-dihydroxy-2-naphthoate octaprenyltransferase
MAEVKPSTTSFLFKAAHPWSILCSFLTYSMGLGISIYLGHPLDGGLMVAGFGCVLMLEISCFYLAVYFDWLQPGFKLDTEKDVPSTLNRQVFLNTAVACLATGAVLTTLICLKLGSSAALLLVLGMGVILAVAYGVPPVRLIYSGYGELVEAILVCNLPPTLALLLQTKDLHRLLPMLSLPVTFLYLAMLLVLLLPVYASDLKYGRKTLMVRMGWQMGMNLHNVLILSAYALLTVTIIMGLPFKIAFPSLFTLILGVFQIWQVQQVSAGAKPRWNWLIITARALPLVMIYLLTAALWIG